MTGQLKTQIFRYVLRRAQDVTERFDVDLGGLPEDIIRSHKRAEPHVRNVRMLMEEKHISPNDDLAELEYGLANMNEWVEAHGAPIRTALAIGNVVAIDGTPLIPFQQFLTAQVYACAIGSLTYKEALQLKAQVIKTDTAGEWLIRSDSSRVHQSDEG